MVFQRPLYALLVEMYLFEHQLIFFICSLETITIGWPWQSVHYNPATKEGGKLGSWPSGILKNILKTPTIFYLLGTSYNHFASPDNFSWLRPWFATKYVMNNPCWLPAFGRLFLSLRQCNTTVDPDSFSRHAFNIAPASWTLTDSEHDS